MYEEYFEECLKNPKVSMMIKTIIFLNILLQICIFSRYKAKPIQETELIKINENDKVKISKIEDFQSSNLSEYNMVKFLAYDNIFFNSMYMFRIFNNKYFDISYLNYTFSKEFKKIKFEFNFGIHNKNKTLIEPSDFTLHSKLTVLCYMNIKQSIIYSLPQIKDNQYYKCIEFFNLNETPEFGMHFFLQRSRHHLTLAFNFTKFLNLNDSENEDDEIFDEDFLLRKYNIILKKSESSETYKNYMLWRNYMKSPICDLKRNAVGDKKGWIFQNIYNNYFCYCIGKTCPKIGVKQMCKLNFYKNVIDINRNLYPKTEYIFVDFIFKDLPSDDTFPVFEEMMKQNLSAHYITEKKELYDEYCGNKTNCQTIIPINRYTYYKFGDFVEKYLTLILKLKAVISCKENSFHYLSYLFYKTEYITYIAVGHGVDYFKDYLFGNFRIYGNKINNKVLIPPSRVLINLALIWGWKEKDIIKINLPRWDRYSNVDHYFSGNITSNSILVMFTWRYTKWWYGFRDISDLYHENIIKLLEDPDLLETLTQKNMTMYFSLHRYINEKYLHRYDKAIKNIENIKNLKQNEISECLAKTNLVVSDFSSIIFDIMSRDKPFVLYVPDENDPTINKYYTNDYINLIRDMKSGRIKFKNKCNTIKETVNMIIKYINNNFEIEPDLKEFYKSFNFKTNNNSIEFVEYLTNLK